MILGFCMRGEKNKTNTIKDTISSIDKIRIQIVMGQKYDTYVKCKQAENSTVVIYKKMSLFLIFQKCTLTRLGRKGHNICRLFSNDSMKKIYKFPHLYTLHTANVEANGKNNGYN